MFNIGDKVWMVVGRNPVIIREYVIHGIRVSREGVEYSFDNGAPHTMQFYNDTYVRATFNECIATLYAEAGEEYRKRANAISEAERSQLRRHDATEDA